MIDEIIRSNSLALDHLRQLVADVPEELMTRQANGVVNHPAWTLGHLTYSCELIGGEIGMVAWLPTEWSQRFGTGSVPADDPQKYPSKDELLAVLHDGHQRVFTRLREIGETGLAAPLPDQRHRAIFPTIGHAVLHILTSHAAAHVGQVTVWRRVVGLGPLQQPFV